MNSNTGGGKAKGNFHFGGRSKELTLFGEGDFVDDAGGGVAVAEDGGVEGAGGGEDGEGGDGFAAEFAVEGVGGRDVWATAPRHACRATMAVSHHRTLWCSDLPPSLAAERSPDHSGRQNNTTSLYEAKSNFSLGNDSLIMYESEDFVGIWAQFKEAKR